MGMPLTACLIFRAARNEEGARKRLAEIVEYNREFGAFTFHNCKHEPHCTATEEQFVDLFREQPQVYRLLEQMAE